MMYNTRILEWKELESRDMTRMGLDQVHSQTWSNGVAKLDPMILLGWQYGIILLTGGINILLYFAEV